MKFKIKELKYLSMIVCAASILEGCATEGKSIALGGGIGAGTGALVGAIADPGKNGELRTRNIIIGSALGGVAGIAAGALLHDSSEEKQKEAFLAGQKSGSNKAPPPYGPGLSQAKVDIEWVDGKAVGNRWIDGHYERIITEPTHWDPDSK